jgi:hypothetical protein
MGIVVGNPTGPVSQPVGLLNLNLTPQGGAGPIGPVDIQDPCQCPPGIGSLRGDDDIIPTPPAPSGPLQLIQTQVVSGSPVGSVVFSGLNGDVDAKYIIAADILGVGTGAFSAEFVSSILNAGSNGQRMDGSPPGFPWFFSLNGFQPNFWHHIMAEFTAKTGRYRQGRSQLTRFIPGSGILFEDWVWGTLDTTTIVTSFSIQADGGSFGVGSSISLYRLKDM